MNEDWYKALNIRPEIVVSAFAGGFAYILYLTRMGKTQPALMLLSRVLLGILIANYLGGWVVEKTGIPEKLVGFVIGFLGEETCIWFFMITKTKMNRYISKIQNADNGDLDSKNDGTGNSAKPE